MRRRALLTSVVAATAGCVGFRGSTDDTTASPSETHTSLPAESAYDYRGRFDFETSLPRRVVVRHDGTVVTDATCG